jgi:hypothetical protein
MLPANSGNAGWQEIEISTTLLFPRNGEKLPLVTQCFRTDVDVVWTATYIDGTGIVIANELGVTQQTLVVTGVLNVDIAFDQLNRVVIIYSKAADLIYLYWYDPNLAAHTTTQIALGQNPCCMLDERRAILIPNSDIFIFYQRLDLVFYRLQRDRYLIEYPVPHNVTGVVLQTCGMGINLRMTLRSLSDSAVLVAVGDRYVAMGTEQLGYHWGTVPWDRN